METHARFHLAQGSDFPELPNTRRNQRPGEGFWFVGMGERVQFQV